MIVWLYLLMIIEVEFIVEVICCQGYEFGYGSLEIRDNDIGGMILFSVFGSDWIKVIFVQEEFKECSLSSFSSLEDEFYGEFLGESCIMVMDLDVLLVQKVVLQIEGIFLL